jgi:signal transduction histidine kinase
MFSILAIDDDPGVLRALEKALSPALNATLDALAADLFDEAPKTPPPRFAVKACGSGEEGAAWLRAQVALGTEPGVAIVDMRMPGGWGGVQTIRALWEASPELQVVICTAYADYTWEDLLDALGATDSMLVLKKPFDGVELRQAALALSEKWRLARERAHMARALSQAQRLESVGRIAGGVAHDLNNMLTALLGEAALLAAEVGEREEVIQIQEVASRAHELARTLTLLSQAPRWDVSAQAAAQPLDVGALLGSMQPLLRRLVPARVALEVQVDPDAPLVEVGEVELLRVLLNLVINAADATSERGTVSVSVGGVVDGRGARWLRLLVSDTGSGMPESVRRHLFEPFFTTKPLGKGTGLGLVVVKEVIEAARGRVEVASEVGVGTSFEVMLPAAQEPHV